MPKSGLLIGVILGAALVSQVNDILSHMTIKDMWQVKNGAAAALSLRRDRGLAQIAKLIPPPGSTIESSEIISWEPIVGASDYRIFVGTYKGGVNLGRVQTGNETIAIIDNIPQNGEPVFVRLSYTVDGREQYFDASYVTENSTSEVVGVAQSNPFNPPAKKSGTK